MDEFDLDGVKLTLLEIYIEDKEAENGFRKESQTPKSEFYANGRNTLVYAFKVTEKSIGAVVTGKARFAYLKPNTAEIREEEKLDKENSKSWFNDYKQALDMHSEKV